MDIALSLLALLFTVVGIIGCIVPALPGVILSYICPLMYMNNPLSKKMPVITSSNKLRTYSSARYYSDAEILDKITKEGNSHV